jgi:hypothetical protein
LKFSVQTMYKLQHVNAIGFYGWQTLNCLTALLNPVSNTDTYYTTFRTMPSCNRHCGLNIVLMHQYVPRRFPRVSRRKTFRNRQTELSKLALHAVAVPQLTVRIPTHYMVLDEKVEVAVIHRN